MVLRIKRQALSTENRDLMSQVVGGIPVSIDTNQDAHKVRSIISLYNNRHNDNWLTPEMMDWVDEKMAQFDVDMVNATMVDGSPLFDDDRIERLSETEKKAEVLALALKGKNVKCRDSNDNEVVFLPQIADNRPKSTWDKIVEFFKNLFGIDGISKIREGIEEAHEKNAQVREKMSLEEISGRKGLNKVAPPAKKKDAPSTEMNRR